MWDLWNLRIHNKRLLDQRGKQEQETTKLEEKMLISVKKKTLTILTDFNIGIADTGATVHSSANTTSANNWDLDTSNIVLVMENGKKEQVTKI
jgi:predicted double-glycine peptidase